jgi:DNA-binding Xre family transcriptional regulator
MPIHIGRAVRTAHAIAGIKHIKVAQQIGVSAANYSHSLTHRGMTVKRYKEICDALGMSMDDVFKIGEEYADGDSE